MGNRRTLLVSTIIILAMSNWAMPAVQTYVSSSGKDVFSCSISKPCRTFQEAFNNTDPGGEIIVLDSAEYGPIASVNKAVSIIAPPGVYAGIVVSSGHALTINAGAGDVVVLRGLTITGMPAPFTNGIVYNSGKALYVENCVVGNFPVKAILSLSSGLLYVKDSTFRENSIGISLDAPTIASIDGVRLEGNEFGLVSSLGSVATIRDSVASGNTNAGLLASTLAGTTAELNIERCLVANNATGIRSEGFGGGVSTLRLSSSTVTDNGIGLHQAAGGSILSRGNNTVEGNVTDVMGVLAIFLPK